MKELDCLFIGSSTKDILMLVEAPPASDQRIAARQLEITCGGVSAIAGAAHQSLHGVTGVITALGDDDTSHFVEAFLARQNFAYAKLFLPRPGIFHQSRPGGGKRQALSQLLRRLH